ncbi:MAG TPA: TonB-dependent receptor [Candidatus Acidoferrales bacterium]|nr:TonB-dependent receptor [Candidatus Acidoferrales bacterium]
MSVARVWVVCVASYASLLTLVSGPAFAQFRGVIEGTVKDAAGGVIPGAKVTLTNNETQRQQSMPASEYGFYHFAGLPPGSYNLEASARGMSKGVVSNITLAGEATQGVDLTLQAGEVTASVTVTSDVIPAVETETANVSANLSAEAVRNLPQVGRDPYELVRLAPGVFGDAARSGTGGSVALPNASGPGGSNSAIFQTENQIPIVANGQRTSQNNFEIDGVSVNSLTWGGAAVVTPNQESVKSIRVASSDYSAEAGRNSGAQIQVVSQNGTNQFHGSGFFKYNDPVFNAFNKFGGPGAPDVRVDQLLRQFGASVGGPIVKNKLFFFFSYEGLRQGNTSFTTAYVETPQYRQQVVAARPGSIIAQIFNNPGIAPRVAAYIPVACPAGFAAGTCQPVSGGLDLGSLTGARGQYVDFAGNPAGGGLDGIPDIAFAQLALPGQTNGNQYNARVDFNPTSADSFAVSTYISNLDQLSADAAGGSRPLGDLPFKPFNTAATATYNRTLSPTLLNEARFNFTRFEDNGLADAANVNFGIPRLEVEGLALPDRIRFGAPQSETTPSKLAQNQYEFRDSLSKVAGNHALKFGAELRWEQDNNSLVGGARPLYSFQGLFNLANDTPVFEQINADPSTGAPADAQRYFRTHTYGLYAQDQWKVRPDLTLTLGLRWEYFSPITETRNRVSNLVYASPATLLGARVETLGQLVHRDRNNFAPRFGFAYNPRRWSKLVVRGGFGVYYQRVPDVLFANTRGNPPFFARFGLCCGNVSAPFDNGQILYALGGSNSIYSYPVNPALAIGIDPVTGAVLNRTVEVWGAQQNFPTAYAYVYSWNFEYSLPARMVASAGYQGSTDHHLIRIVNQNFLYPNNPAFGPVYFPQPDVNSNYNALNLGLTRSFAAGLGIQANYRWSKSIDQLSNEGPGASSNQTWPQDQSTERGPSDFDATHSLTVAAQYELPWYKNRKDLRGTLLGGFQISPILTWHSGFPYTVKIGQSVSTPGGPSLGPVRPTAFYGNAVYDNSNDALISGTNWPGGGAQYFNIAAAGPPGIGRNSFRGPRYFATDLSIAKQFKLPSRFHLGEAAVIDVRANFYNLFNTLNLTPFGFFDPGIFADSPQFGRATQPGLAGRVVEFQGRFSF